MKNIILYTFISILLFGCKKENPEPLYQLFLSFEKDNKEYKFEGTESPYANNPSFSFHLKKDKGSSSTIFTMQSWCAFKGTEQGKGADFYINITQFDTSHVLSQIGVDKVFSEGVKNLDRPSFVIIPDDSISHTIVPEYITANPIRTKYNHYNCDQSELAYFEITKYEKFHKGDDNYHVIIEAKFDLVLCDDEGETVELKNGKLRYFYFLH